MTKETGLIILGSIVALTPFIGIPGSWKTVVFIFVGILIVLFGFLLRLRRMIESRDILSKRGKHTDSYVENGIQAQENNVMGDDSKVQRKNRT